MTRDQQKEEALERMKLLDLHQNAINEFKDEDKLNVSEENGALFWLDDELKPLIEKFEKKYRGVVYHVISSYVLGEHHMAFLYVSPYEEEWEYDRADLSEGYPVVYVENLTAPDMSEFGEIGIKPMFGGVVRTY